MVHVGHPALPVAQRLSRHACSIGVDAIMVAPPTIYPALSLELLVEYLAAIMGECPTVPAYYYHYPMLYQVPTYTPCETQLLENPCVSQSNSKNI